MFEVGRETGGVFLALLFTFAVRAAPGDVQLDILTVTGDAAAGPGGNVISSFEVTPAPDVAPVAIYNDGIVSFAANVDVGGDLEYGFYQARSVGDVSIIL